MKRLVLGILLIACLPVFGQDQPKSPNYQFTVYRKAGTYLIDAFVDAEHFTVTSNGLEVVSRDPATCLLRLTGGVEIRTKDVLLQADEADYHCGTGAGDIEPRGNVHLRVRLLRN
jgi:lipopolysaccharide assembly outer membrane protein LptD (OstA)